jgi:predicted translin family RNA/ssDNA-binding protein
MSFVGMHSISSIIKRVYCELMRSWTRGVSHCGLAIYIKKYLKAIEELWKFKYFTMQKHNLQKKTSTRNQNPSRYHNSITNLKFQHKPKYHLSKILL